MAELSQILDRATASTADATPPPVVRYLGIDYADLDVDAAASLIAGRDPRAPFAYVVTPNAQHVVHLHRGTAGFVEPYGHAWLRLSDSRVAVGLARLLAGVRLPSAAGSDLTVRLFTHHLHADDAITVIGGSEEMIARLRERFGLRRIHHHVPPMGFINDPAAVAACVAFIDAHPARFVFVAVGAPQSERLSQAVWKGGKATGIGLCIGSSLLFLTGLTPRAPRWMRRCGLEWLFRLALNPRRHFRRVFVESLPLVGLIVADSLGRTGRTGRSGPTRRSR